MNARVTSPKLAAKRAAITKAIVLLPLSSCQADTPSITMAPVTYAARTVCANSPHNVEFSNSAQKLVRTAWWFTIA